MTFNPFLVDFFCERSACEEQFDYRDGENISSGSCSTVCDWAQTHHRSRLEAKFGDLASRVTFVLELWTVLQPFCFFIGMFWDIWYPSFFAYSAYSTHSVVNLRIQPNWGLLSLWCSIFGSFSASCWKSCVAEGITSWVFSWKEMDFAADFFLWKIDEANKRVSSLGSAKILQRMFQQFDRFILAEEIRTCAITKPNPELTPTNPSTSTTDPLVIRRGTGIRSGRVGIFGRNDRCKKLLGRRSQEWDCQQWFAVKISKDFSRCLLICPSKLCIKLASGVAKCPLKPQVNVFKRMFTGVVPWRPILAEWVEYAMATSHDHSHHRHRHRHHDHVHVHGPHVSAGIF